MELGNTGISLLEHTSKRLEKVPSIDRVVFAIPDTKENDALASYLKGKGLDYYRGSEDNVLERFYECAIKYSPRLVVRATCDNPCVDYEEAERLINEMRGFDYAVTDNAPLGTAVEVFTADALNKAYHEAQSDVDREHVTPYLYRNENLFRVLYLPSLYESLKDLRLTVDTAQDMALMNEIFSALYRGEVFSNSSLYTFLANHPQLLSLNASVKQKTI